MKVAFQKNHSGDGAVEGLDWREPDGRDTWKKDFTGRINRVDWMEIMVKEKHTSKMIFRPLICVTRKGV